MGLRSAIQDRKPEAATATREASAQPVRTPEADTRHEQSTTPIVGVDSAEDHFGMMIPDRRTLQRLRMHEETYGKRVHEWVDEGMPTDIMGKTNDMAAFRKRQAERPSEVPTNIERQNKRSVMRSEQAAGGPTQAGDAGVPESVREVISSTGRSLDPSIQRAMEDRMGDSLGDVRIHTDASASAACEAINARAFTVGNHIAFNSGEYDPGSPEGQHVLAHELAHVRQQTGGAVSMLPQEGLELEIDPDPALEREAEETAQRVMSGGELGIQRPGKTEVHIQRAVGSPQSGYLSGGSKDVGTDGPGLLGRVTEWMRGDGYEPDDGGVESLDSDSLSGPLQTVVDDVAELKQTVYGDDGIDTKKVATKGIGPAALATGAGLVAGVSVPAAAMAAGGAFLAGSSKELYGQSIERSLKRGSPFEQEFNALKSKFNTLAEAVGLGKLVESDTGSGINKNEYN